MSGTHCVWEGPVGLGEWLSELEVGQPAALGHLTVLPLYSRRASPRDYVFLGEALAQDTFRITEVSEQGSVPELLATNTGTLPVLLIDGEELIGAKQNRVLNLSLLVPAGTELKIPVTCVEQGRWRRRSAAFAEAGRTLFASTRARKSRTVTESLKRGRRTADQNAVWRDVSNKLDELRVASATRAMADAYEQRAQRLNEYVQQLRARADGCGAVFALGGVPVALELFDSVEAFQIAWPKLVRSYALEAMWLSERDQDSTFATASVTDLLDRTRNTRPVRYPALGLGEDVRVPAANGLSGGGLLLDGRLIHLSVFDATALERLVH